MAERFCRSCGGWHDLSEPWPAQCYLHFGTPNLGYSTAVPVPNLIADHMEPVQSMLDGKMYDSKRQLRATYKAAGVVEVGNDSSIARPSRKPKPDRNAIKASVGRAFSRAGLDA